MIKTIRILLEYNTYCLWLYNEKDEVVDNDTPPEWVMSIVFRTFDYKNPERSCPIVFQDSRSRSIGCPTAATAAGGLTLRSGRRTVH